MTCKDCLYYEKCYSRIQHSMDIDEGTGKLITDIEKRYPSFKNKADFVEVVRCKDCKKARSIDNVGNHRCFVYQNTVKGIHFCSYGEKRE